MLTGWDETKGPRPRVLYTIPTGQNPTSLTQPAHRKRAVYDVCRRHALTIIEDDAYYLLQFPTGAGVHSPLLQCGWKYKHTLILVWPADSVPGLCALGQSLLSMDVDGRVVRLDTFSKILSPGCSAAYLTSSTLRLKACAFLSPFFFPLGLRIGYASGPQALLEKLVHFLMAASLGAPSISQVLIAELVTRDDGALFTQQLKRVQTHYAHKAAVLDAALCKHVGERASWQRPTAGMFLWLRLHGIEVLMSSCIIILLLVVVVSSQSPSPSSTTKPCWFLPCTTMPYTRTCRRFGTSWLPTRWWVCLGGCATRAF